MKKGVLWSSSVTNEMVKGMDTDKVNELLDELNDAVMRVCEDFGLE